MPEHRRGRCGRASAEGRSSREEGHTGHGFWGRLTGPSCIRLQGRVLSKLRTRPSRPGRDHQPACRSRGPARAEQGAGRGATRRSVRARMRVCSWVRPRPDPGFLPMASQSWRTLPLPEHRARQDCGPHGHGAVRDSHSSLPRAGGVTGGRHT